MMLLSLAWSMAALAQDSIPSDSELEERLLSTPDAQQVVRAAAPPWWLWPMGLLGAAGVAGMVIRSRKTDRIPGHITVLSRATLSRAASLAMIEVADSNGQTRRMLIGVGGGAPRLVSDLSGISSTQAQFSARDLSGYAESPRDTAASRSSQRPSEQSRASDGVGQRLSVNTPGEPGAGGARLSGRVAKAYANSNAGTGADKLDLVAEVLAERGKDDVAEIDESPSDPWAKNFEALLERRSV
jgi:hypothetical protein